MSTLSLLNSHSLLTIPTISTHTQTCSTVSLCPCSYCCSPFVLWWKSVWCISLCAIPGRVCACARAPALFVSYSIQQSPVMDNELHKHSYLVRQVKYACVKELFKLLQKAALYQNKRRQGKTRAATSARVFMAFTTLNVWFRLSLVSILVFITTITKLVVKEQLRITVHIHRYHHNTYLD